MIDEQTPAQTVLMNHTERRNSPRTSIRRLAYVNLDPYDNGGVITDISRDGLRFHMVNPVEHCGLVHLSILLGNTNQIQVVGELIWMDPARKVGGLRFTVLPEGAADQILLWAEAANTADRYRSDSSRRSQRVNASSTPNPAPQQQPAPTSASTSAAPPFRTAVPPQAAPVPSTAEPNMRSPWVPPSARPPLGADAARMRSSDLPGTGAAGPLPAPLPPTMPWITHFDPDPPSRQWSFVRGVLGGFVLCAVVGGAALLALRSYGWQNLSRQLGAPSSPAVQVPNPAGTDNSGLPQGSPSGSIPSPAIPTPRTNLNPRINPSPDITDDAAAEPKSPAAPEGPGSTRNPSFQAPIAELAPPAGLTSDRGSAVPASQQTGKPAVSQPAHSPDAGESQLMLARQYLDGRVQPRNPTVASQLLWSAVEKGNSAAEMDLADLYLHGDGVTRNCDQARVLLSVASGKGNVEAMQKLRELNRAGCR